MDAVKQEALRLYHEALTARRQLAEIRQQMKAQDAEIEKAISKSNDADFLIYGLLLGMLAGWFFNMEHNAIEWAMVGLICSAAVAGRLFRAVQLDAERRERARLAATRDLIKAAHPFLVNQFVLVNEGADPSEDEARKIVEWIAKSLPQS